MRTLHLTLLVGLAAAAPAAEPQPGSLHKLHGWLCKRHPHNRWCVEHATSVAAEDEEGSAPSIATTAVDFNAFFAEQDPLDTTVETTAAQSYPLMDTIVDQLGKDPTLVGILEYLVPEWSTTL